MSDQNVLVSSGKCYTAPGEELDSSFIPCGNDAFGHQTCCGAGDKCLADGACFGEHGSGYGHMLTYWAGCTDSEYKDSICPKKQVDQPWVALTLCDDSGGAWAICSQEGDPKTLQPGSYCSCTDESKATIAFKDADKLDDVAALPQNTGDTISFFQGHLPTATKPTATGGGGDGSGGGNSGGGGNTGGGGSTGGGGGDNGTSTSDPAPATSHADGPSATERPTTERKMSPSSDRATGTTSPEPTGSPTSSTAKPTTITSTGAAGSVTTVTTTAADTSSPTGGSGGDSAGSSSDDGGLSSSAIIGIGVGVGVAAILLLAAVILLLRRRRRLLRGPGPTASDLDEKKAAGMPPSSPPSGPGLAGAGRYEADGRPMKEPGKLRSELAGGFGLGKGRIGRGGSRRRGPSELPTDTGVGRDGTAELPADTAVGRDGAAELSAHSARARARPSARDSLVPAPLQIRHNNEALPEEPLPAGAGLPPLQSQAGGLAHSAPDQPRVAPSVKPWGAQWRRT